MTDTIKPIDQPQVNQKRKYTVDPNNKPGPTPTIEKLYKTVEAFEKKVAAYFNGAAYKRKVITQFGGEVQIPTPTISDLVLFLGFTDKKSFCDHYDHPVFGDAIKIAKTMIEREYEMQLRGTNYGGAIFALKNFGWTDKQEIVYTGNIQTMSTIIVDEKPLRYNIGRGDN